MGNFHPIITVKFLTAISMLLEDGFFVVTLKDYCPGWNITFYLTLLVAANKAEFISYLESGFRFRIAGARTRYSSGEIEDNIRVIVG